jgi:hypothetical protein
MDWADLPTMRGLTEKQRKYVLAQASDPFGTSADWARQAGYSNTGDAASVRSAELKKDARIQAAVAEVARYTLGYEGPMLAAASLLRILRNPEHPKHMRAVEMTLNRTGMHKTTEHTVKVEHTDRTGKALEQRLRQAAQILGIDAERLLRVNAPKWIEVQAVALDEGVTEDAA